MRCGGMFIYTEDGRGLIMSRLKEYKIETQTILTRTYYLDAKDHDHAEDIFYECINE